MKKFQMLIAIAIVVLLSAGIFVTGCRKNAKEPASPPEISLKPEAIPQVLYGASVGELKLPDGTTTEVVDGGSTVKFKFPEGIFLVGFTADREYVELPGTEYTCTGNCTKGCDVLYAAGSFGCSACDPATVVCTGKAKTLSELEGKGFINLNAGISFLTDKKEAEALYAGPHGLLAIPKVREAMKAFNLKIHGTENPDFSNASQFREVGINLFGCVATYMVPVSYARTAEVDGELVDAAAWSCRCDAPANSSGCTKDSGIGYKRCESGACTSCTMIMN